MSSNDSRYVGTREDMLARVLPANADERYCLPSFLTRQQRTPLTAATSASVTSSATGPSPMMNHKSTRVTAKTLAPEIDDIIEEDLAQISSSGRKRIEEEIRGIAAVPIVEEGSNFVQQRLKQLDSEIKKTRLKKLYDRALYLSPRRIKDTNFRLPFLRADDFHPRRSAIRLMKYFELKMQLFGTEKLADPITLADLDRYDNCMEVFASAGIQTLPCTDRSGRTVIFSTIALPIGLNQLRVIWYQIMASLDQSTQKRGLVYVLYLVGKPIPPTTSMGASGDVFQLIRSLVDSLPIKFAAIHICKDDKRMCNPLRSMFTFLSHETRVRCRFHYGTHGACLNSLEKVGITRGILPVDSSGRSQTDDFIRYVEYRRQKEEAIAIRESEEAPHDRVIAPTSADVLLGKGRSYHCDHPGNKRFGNLIDQYYGMHKSSPDEQKTVISVSIVQMIKEVNGRFLKMDKKNDLWVVQSDEVARKKVAHAFRARSEKLGKGGLMFSSTGGGNGKRSEGSDDNNSTEEDETKPSKRPKLN